MGIFKKVKSLRADFEAVARRFAAATTLAFLSATSFAQTPSAPVNNNSSKTEHVSKFPSLTAAQREKINQALILQGQGQFKGLLPFVQDGYSRQLQSLQDELNGRLQKNHPHSRLRVVVLDPLQMDAGLALGFSQGDVAVLMLRAQGIEPDFMLAYQAADALTNTFFVSAAHDTTYTQNPNTIMFGPDSLGNVVRVMIPFSDYAPALDIPGLSLRDEVQSVDRHEGWHAINLKSDMSDIDFSKIKSDSLLTIDQKINNIDYLKFHCFMYNDEAYADIGSAGDMIRNGSGLDLIEHLVDVRMAKNKDVKHMSPPGLRELQRRIDVMGIDKFRALDDRRAEQLYNDILDKTGLTPARLALVYQYVQCKPEERMDFVVKNQADPNFYAAFSYINYFVTADIAERAPGPSGESIANAMMKEMMADSPDLQSWDAKTELQKRAMKIDGKITPVSYVKAYGSLMNEIDSLAASTDPYQQAELEIKSVRLKKTFLKIVAATDYVLVNQAYGVDILKAETSLQKLLQQKKTPIFPQK